jgi:hypothetical protein
MPRDIRIYPKLGSTSSNDFPRIEFNGLSASTISLKVDDDGSVLYTGTYGTLFNISDSKDGILHSVNDVSGLPILQVTSLDYVQMGKWDKYSLVVNSDKVGVGLTAPSAFLHVAPSGSLTAPLILASGSSTQDLVRITQVGTGNALVVEDSTNPDSTPFVIANDGRVGIGTATPSADLHITETSTTIPLIIASGSSTADLVRITQVGTGNAFVVEDVTNPDATPFVIDASGNVGIGLTGPASMLHISNSTATTPLIIASGSSTQDLVRITQVGTGNAFVVEDAANPDTSRFVIDPSGNVGIGLTGPASLLHISGGSITTPVIIASGSSTADLVRITQVGSGNALVVEDSTNPDATPFVVTGDGRVGIGITGPSASLHILGGTATTVFKVDGTSGELFSISDSLVGSLFSVNDISGLPIMEVFSDNTTFIGDYQSPGMYTSKRTTLVTGTNSIYAFATASYTGAFVDYTATSGSNARAGSIGAVWLGSSIQFNESSTLDIGTTSALTFSFVISGTYAVLQAGASTQWELKTIIRSI